MKPRHARTSKALTADIPLPQEETVQEILHHMGKQPGNF